MAPIEGFLFILIGVIFVVDTITYFRVDARLRRLEATLDAYQRSVDLVRYGREVVVQKDFTE